MVAVKEKNRERKIINHNKCGRAQRITTRVIIYFTYAPVTCAGSRDYCFADTFSHRLIKL